MMTSELLQLAGAAAKVADLAEELLEFVWSLGPDMLEQLTDMEEFRDFDEAVQNYLQVRDTTDVQLY